MRPLLLLLAAWVTTAMSAQAQDAVTADPKHYKVEFENEQVRVLRISYGPGEKSVMHQHPANVAVFLTDARRADRSNSLRREVSIQAILRPLMSVRFVISVAEWVSPWRSNHRSLSGTEKSPTRNA